MEKEMRELYIEGVAIRGGPESCVGVREGVGEALTGVRAGWAIEPRKHCNQGADAVEKQRKARSAVALSRVAAGPCVVEEPGHARNLHAREPGGPVFAQSGRLRCGPRGERLGGTPLMNERGKSDGPVVPAKPPNKPERAGAEAVEGRGPVEGNTASRNACRTQSRATRVK